MTSYYKARKPYSRVPFVRQPGAKTSMRQTDNPSPFIQQPWNKWTYERTNSTIAQFATETVTVGDVITQLKNKVQLQDTATVRFKIQNAKIWGTSSGTQFPVPDIDMKFFQTTTSASTIKYPRSSIRDKGTLNKPAKGSYIYPVTDRMVILDGTLPTTELFEATSTNPGTDVTFRCNILWQTGSV